MFPFGIALPKSLQGTDYSKCRCFELLHQGDLIMIIWFRLHQKHETALNLIYYSRSFHNAIIDMSVFVDSLIWVTWKHLERDGCFCRFQFIHWNEQSWLSNLSFSSCYHFGESYIAQIVDDNSSILIHQTFERLQFFWARNYLFGF